MIQPNAFVKIAADGTKLPIDSEQWDAVLDESTGLMWAREAVKVTSWAEGENAAGKLRTLGFEDWRVPTRRELLTLVDDTRSGPAIDTTFFPDCPSDWFWTSTSYAGSPAGYAWGIGFFYGNAHCPHHDDDGFVRAVRASQ